MQKHLGTENIEKCIKKMTRLKKVDFTCFKILPVFLFYHMRHFLWNDPFSYAIVSIMEYTIWVQYISIFLLLASVWIQYTDTCSYYYWEIYFLDLYVHSSLWRYILTEDFIMINNQFHIFISFYQKYILDKD